MNYGWGLYTTNVIFWNLLLLLLQWFRNYHLFSYVARLPSHFILIPG